MTLGGALTKCGSGLLRLTAALLIATPAVAGCPQANDFAGTGASALAPYTSQSGAAPPRIKEVTPEKPPVATFGTTVVIPGGLRGEVYNLFPPQAYTSLPDFNKLKPVGTIYTNTLNVTPRQWKKGFPGLVSAQFEWFAIDYRGRFWIERPGRYRFSLVSDDGSKLYIDDKLVINNDGVHQVRGKDVSGNLSGGIHRIRVSYFQGPRFELALMLRIAGPGERMHPFDTEKLKPPSNPEAWEFGNQRDLMVPDDARRAHEIGRDLLVKTRLAEAQKELLKAVEIYPQYAEAWQDLGLVLQSQNQTLEARKAYLEAIACDSLFEEPYLSLAQLSAVEGNWKDVLDRTSSLRRLNSRGHPQALYLSALAHYNLDNFENAFADAQQAAQLDLSHTVPQAELLLGMLCYKLGDYKTTAEQLRKFLQYVPPGTEVDMVKSLLAEAEKRAVEGGR